MDRASWSRNLWDPESEIKVPPLPYSQTHFGLRIVRDDKQGGHTRRSGEEWGEEVWTILCAAHLVKGRKEDCQVFGIGLDELQKSMLCPLVESDPMVLCFLC